MRTEAGVSFSMAGRPFQPDLDWAVATDFTYLREGMWLPLLVEFDPKSANTESSAAQWRWFIEGTWLPPAFRTEVIVPDLFVDLPLGFVETQKLRYCVILVHRKAASALVERSEWRRTIIRAELGPPIEYFKGEKAKPVKPKKAGGKKVRRVVMAAIDQGIAFAHQRFSNQAGTRIENLWQQDVLPAGIPAIASPLPNTGVEITASDINAAMAASYGDEAAVYQSIGGLDYSKEGYKPLARHGSHGTEVLNLMAGERFDDDVKNRPIIAVDLPEIAVGDPSGSLLTPHAAWGLVYIMNRAEQLRDPGERLPVVVNLSYGPTEGPHDGTGLFEAFADLMITFHQSQSTPLTLVLAAGNFRDDRIHAQASLKKGKLLELPWRLQPGGRTASYLQVWLNSGAQAEVTLMAPTGETIQVGPSGSMQGQVPPAPALPIFEAKYEFSPVRPCISLTIARTEFDPFGANAQPIAGCGVWKVFVKNTGNATLRLNAWIRRSETPVGRRAHGRQSYFDRADYARFTSTGFPLYFDASAAGIVRRRNTISGIATGSLTKVIGGFRRSDYYPARYSSQGPHGNLQRVANTPDWVEPSEDSMTCRGVLSAGNLSGSVAAIGGTSAAAPQAARRLAELWVATSAHPVPPPTDFKPLQQGLFRPISLGDRTLVGGMGAAKSNPQVVPRP